MTQKYIGLLYLKTNGKYKLVKPIISEIYGKSNRYWRRDNEPYDRVIKSGLKLVQQDTVYLGMIGSSKFEIPRGSIFELQIKHNEIRLIFTKTNNPNGPYGFKIFVRWNQELLLEVEEV